MASRDISDLNNEFKPYVLAVLRIAKSKGLDLLIYCTLRDNEEQAMLYRQGRTLTKIKQKAEELTQRGRSDLATMLMDVGPQSGHKIKTFAGPGQSFHQYGLAFDAVPMRDGKPVWGTESTEDKAIWDKYGECVEEAGLEWSGRWVSLKEYPHAQMKNIDIDDLLHIKFKPLPNYSTISRIRGELAQFEKRCEKLANAADQQDRDITATEMQTLHEDYQQQKTLWDLLMNDAQPSLKELN